MLTLLIRFWPVLLPLILYGLWQFSRRRKAHKAGEEKPRWRDGPWFWAVLATLGLAIGCLMFWGFQNEEIKGTYIPPQLINGKIVPGHVE